MSRIAAADEPLLPMTREEYRAWAMAQPRGRFERINGIVVPMAPEGVSHAIVKARVWRALDQALASAGLDNCQALPDGVTVEVDDNDYEPDAIVHCGPLDLDGVTANNPLVIVEVLSPSTRSNDRALKAGRVFPPAIAAPLSDRLDRQAAGRSLSARRCHRRPRHADRY